MFARFKVQAACTCRAPIAWRSSIRPFHTTWQQSSRAAMTAETKTLVETNESALYSFGARIKADLDMDLLRKAVIPVARHSGEEDNSVLAFVGKRVAGLYATEYLHCKYPNLHPNAFNAVLKAYIGNQTMNELGKSLGLSHVMVSPDEAVKPGETPMWTSTARANCMFAIIGALHTNHGAERAKVFVHAHLLSRPLDIRPLVKVPEPKRHVSMLLRKLGKVPAESRLLSETGRLSSSPVFVVGIFSAEEKLGEGFGSSMKMAEFRACQDALFQYYGREEKDYTLPSDSHHVDSYAPPVLGDTQAIV